MKYLILIALSGMTLAQDYTREELQDLFLPSAGDYKVVDGSSAYCPEEVEIHTINQGDSRSVINKAGTRPGHLDLRQLSVPFHGTKLVCNDYTRHRVLRNSGPAYTKCVKGQIVENFWGDGVDMLTYRMCEKNHRFTRKKNRKCNPVKDTGTPETVTYAVGMVDEDTVRFSLREEVTWIKEVIHTCTYTKI